MSKGVEMIAAERQRQIDQEGYGSEHDSHYEFGMLACAGITYVGVALASDKDRDSAREQKPWFWPWSPQSWKFTNGNDTKARISDLKKAGALIAAEIDRILEGEENHER